MTTLYTGRTTHRRSLPKMHGFGFDLSMVLFDADRVGGPNGTLAAGRGQRIERTDLFDREPATTLGDAVRNLIDERTGHRPDGPVRTLCIARSANYVFNPLTVHWVLSAATEQPEVVVLEVTNTPWKERHFYVLEARAESTPGAAEIIAHRSADGTISASFPKELHVSPFGAMDEHYQATISAPGSRIAVALDNFSPAGEPVMSARLDLRVAPDTTKLRRPWLFTRRVWMAIHWQALRLFCKRVPVKRHPNSRPRVGSRRPR